MEVNFFILKVINKNLFFEITVNGDWGLGIGDWVPNPQSPIPNLRINIIINLFNNKIK
jgi:hypothetical protein